MVKIFGWSKYDGSASIAITKDNKILAAMVFLPIPIRLMNIGKQD